MSNTNAIAPAIASIAPFTGPAAPFVLAAAALVNVGLSIYHLFANYDPQALHDTAVVEAFEMTLHTTWYTVTGEILPGIPGVSQTTTPGNYGNAGINLFQNSAYPNVPAPAGAPGINMQAVIQSVTQSYQAAAASMERPESIPNITNNYNIFMSLFNQVAAAQAEALATDPSGTLPIGVLSGTVDGVPLWGMIAAAIAVVFLTR